MNIYLDSANLTEVKEIQAWGFMTGVTTNPLIIAKEQVDVATRLKEIAGFGFKEVFYQAHQLKLEEILIEAEAAQKILGETLVLKLPPVPESFRVMKALNNTMKICITAVFSPAQALLAREAGASYVAVYVNRATRLLGDGMQLVSELATVLSGGDTTLIAASLKSPEETVQAVMAGADHITLPFATLKDLFLHPLTNSVIEEFTANGTGILGSIH